MLGRATYFVVTVIKLPLIMCVSRILLVLKKTQLHEWLMGNKDNCHNEFRRQPGRDEASTSYLKKAISGRMLQVFFPSMFFFWCLILCSLHL